MEEMDFQKMELVLEHAGFCVVRLDEGRWIWSSDFCESEDVFSSAGAALRAAWREAGMYWVQDMAGVDIAGDKGFTPAWEKLGFVDQTRKIEAAIALSC